MPNTAMQRRLSRPKIKVKQLSEQGFTLMESLVGIVIITVILVAVTPPILLATATRVQNRRAQQAMQLAQGEVDRVRVLLEQGDYTISQLPAVPASSANNIPQVPAPTTVISNNKIKSNNNTCSNLYIPTGTPIAANTAVPVDIDGDCKEDFLVQTFRDDDTRFKVQVGATQLPIGFQMGVRVYAAVARQNLNNLETGRASLQFTTADGYQRSRPLVVMYPLLTRSDSNISLEKYRQYLTP